MGKEGMGEHSESRGGDRVGAELVERNCSEDACHSAAATSLDQQVLCPNHFLHRCYAQLEMLNQHGQISREVRVDLAVIRAFILECSRRSLEISLQRENL